MSIYKTTPSIYKQRRSDMIENQYLSSETLYCEFLGFCRTFHISLKNTFYISRFVNSSASVCAHFLSVLFRQPLFDLYRGIDNRSISIRRRRTLRGIYVNHPRTISRPHSCTLTEFQTSRSISKGNLTFTSIFRWHGSECFGVYAFSRAPYTYGDGDIVSSSRRRRWFWLASEEAKPTARVSRQAARTPDTPLRGRLRFGNIPQMGHLGKRETSGINRARNRSLHAPRGEGGIHDKRSPCRVVIICKLCSLATSYLCDFYVD